MHAWRRVPNRHVRARARACDEGTPRAWQVVARSHPVPRAAAAAVAAASRTPAAMAASRADVLSANVFKFSIVGPTKVMPLSAHACQQPEGRREDA